MTSTTPGPAPLLAEQLRLANDKAGKENWRRWGPYLSERQWGTVREDYSRDGEAWEYFPHDHARSRAYRWGEDGIAGFSDDWQHLCLSLGLWNGRDPILKERLFGLTNAEGNHGEDVKELYYYLDATPSHSYLQMLYKYPQAAFPYQRLIDESRQRGADLPEFELLDSGVFDGDRYFDVRVEYAKASPQDILMRVTVHNRGPEAARLVLLPQLWFRNTWSWQGQPCPHHLTARGGAVLVVHRDLGDYRLDCDGQPRLIFCDNETNPRRHFGQPQARGCFKDAFNDFIVHGDLAAVNPAATGSKAGALYDLDVPAGQSMTVRLRLTQSAGDAPGAPWADFEAVFAARRREADEFYAAIQRPIDEADQRLVQRQAFAGMIWGKQFFHYDVQRWLQGDVCPPPAGRAHGRNHDWQHLNGAEVISMPDKWEYPWFAAWDLAFHCVVLAEIDVEFAKGQLVTLTREWYMHPNGQLPAYEWAFGDANPPVHAWAAFRVFQIDRRTRRDADPDDPGDLHFLERVFQKLLLNFTWWVNRKDAQGRNVFQGGFLGLDNVACFDRSQPLPDGAFLTQADGTSWMAMYCLNLLRIALELALHNRVYGDIASKFFEHFLAIAGAINDSGAGKPGLWDETDQFYYDHLHPPAAPAIPLRLRSVVGLIPLLAVEVLDSEVLERLPEFTARMDWFLRHRPQVAALVSDWTAGGTEDRRLLALLRGPRLKALLQRMLDQTQFLSDYGIRSLSKEHQAHPYRFEFADCRVQVDYWPAESHSRLFGGNSNWRGPIWMPLNFLFIEALQKYHYYYGAGFRVECPAGSGIFLNLEEVAAELARRLGRLFLRGADGQRPALKVHPKLAGDPHFKDYLLFHEYFDGDCGRGCGASHQTGWTGLIAKLLRPPTPMPPEPAA